MTTKQHEIALNVLSKMALYHYQMTDSAKFEGEFEKERVQLIKGNELDLSYAKEEIVWRMTEWLRLCGVHPVSSVIRSMIMQYVEAFLNGDESVATEYAYRLRKTSFVRLLGFTPRGCWGV